MSVSTAAAQTWKFTATDDHYYKIGNDAGQCLAMAGGTLWLQAPMDQDLAPSLSSCATTDARVKNLQKWEILKVANGFLNRNAITQMPLSVNAAGALTQEAPDVRAAGIFSLVGGVSTSIAAPARAAAAQPATVTVTVDNRTAADITDVVVTPVAPAGWKVTPASVQVGTVAAGTTKQATFTATPPAGAEIGNFTFTATTNYKAGGEPRVSSSSVTGLLSCSVDPVRPVAAVVDSFNNGQGEVTPGSNAIDGNPNTFWGTAWTPSNAPLPHTIQVDLGKELELCAVSLLPRQGTSSGAANGRILGYELYLSDTKDALGTLVAKGELPNTSDWARVVLETPATGQFLTLKALSEQKGQPWTTLAELTVDASDPSIVIPTEEPTDPGTVDPTDEPTVEPTDEPTVDPTDEPTVDPSDPGTVDPSDEPTDPATDEPTEPATVDPTAGPGTNPGTATGTPGTTTPGGSASTQAAADKDGLANTGTATTALWGGALLMALLGAGIVVGNRRRAGLHK